MINFMMSNSENIPESFTIRIYVHYRQKIAKEAQSSGRTVREVSREMTDLSELELDEILDPSSMTEPGLTG